jgi:hypothetical protein
MFLLRCRHISCSGSDESRLEGSRHVMYITELACRDWEIPRKCWGVSLARFEHLPNNKFRALPPHQPFPSSDKNSVFQSATFHHMEYISVWTYGLTSIDPADETGRGACIILHWLCNSLFREKLGTHCYGLDQWYSTFFVRVPLDVIPLQRCTSKVYNHSL